MSYQVLARKWRPQTFAELVGQQHVVSAISNALNNDKLHHAYLFTGTRGVGKTTIARIFSKSLNCEKGQSATPCGVCDTCVDISEGRYVDLLEIDAASRTKVEDTRELLDNVQYRPTRGKYKVYLIDEVHMLSKHSFNALLKTLEEPPEHVKFLLATTDPQKLPVTILSRCLQFTLKALSQDQIHQHLVNILNAENVAFEEPAVAQIAKAAHGSIRDSLSLTDQAIAQGNNTVSLNVVSNMLGLLNKNQILLLIKSICERDSKLALQQLDDICAQSSDYAQILAQILATIHQIALTQVVPEVCKLEGDSAKGIYTLAKSISEQHVQVLYQIGVNGKRDLPYSPDARSGLQMTVLRMLAFSPAQPIDLDIEVLRQPESSSLPSFNELPDTPPTAVEPAPVANAEISAPVVSSSAQTVDETPTVNDVEPIQALNNQGQGSQEPEVNNGAENQQYNNVVDDYADNNNASTHNLDSYQNDVASHQENTHQPYESDMFGEPLPEPSVDSDQVDDAQPQSDEHTQQLLATQKLIDQLAQNNAGDDGGKKPEVTHNDSANSELSKASDYELGKVFSSSLENISAFLPSGEKLTKSAQVDEWSQFVDSTGVQALSRQLLLHANCSELSNPLQLTVGKDQQNLCEQEVVNSVEQVLSAMLQQDIELQITMGDTTNTPFQIQTRINELRMQHAHHVVQTDTSIQELVSAFDGQVINESVEAR